MTIEELHAEMQAGFAKIDTRFKTVDDRFTKLEAQFPAMKRELKRELTRDLKRELRRELKRHEDALRTHFDVMVERMQDSVKLVAEATAHHAVRLDDHEKRIKRLESPRRT